MRLAWALLTVGVAAAVQGEPGLVLRSGWGVPESAALESMGEQGLVLRVDGARVEVPWDRVASLGKSHEPEWEVWRSIAEPAWRARTRLERGDDLGAEDLFEALFEKYRGRQGATSRVVAEGTMRCRLARGALTQAVPAYIALLSAGSPSPGEPQVAWGDAYARLGLDGATGLCPLLAPVWVQLPQVEAMARGGWDTKGLGPRAAAMSRIYEASAKVEAGLTCELGARPEGDEGLALAYDVVAARLEDDPARATAAREALRKRLAGSAGGWTQVWCWAGLGRSLVHSQDEETRWQGVAELLRVPAMAGRTQPYLTGVCLAEAAVTLGALGDGAAAVRLRDEIKSEFPGHPVLRWAALERLTPPPPAARPPKEPKPTTRPGAEGPGAEGGTTGGAP